MADLLRIAGWKRLVVTGLCLAAWRALEQITVTGMNPGFIAGRLQVLDTSSFIHAIGNSIPLASYSIVAMGIGPYINALIIVTLIRGISKRVRTIGNSTDGRLRLERWTRALAVVLTFGQAYGWTVLMQSGQILQPQMDWLPRLVIIVELMGGTMILVLLAELLDEFGLGFGNGAVLIYALSPMAIEVHRLAAFLAAAPSAEALYLPFGIWLAFSIGVVAATVAAVLAVRRVPNFEGKKSRSSNPVVLKVLMSGVLRPPIFANAVLLVPLIVSNYLATSNPDIGRRMTDFMTPYGPNLWADAAYMAVDAGLVIAFAYFVVRIDFAGARLSPDLIGHINRLAVIGGIFLAVTVVVLPDLAWIASRAAGTVIAISGLDAVLVVAMILMVVISLERSGKASSRRPVLASRLP